MTFDKVIDDGRLWAVRFDNDKDNALQKVMSQWADAGGLQISLCRIHVFDEGSFIDYQKEIEPRHKMKQ